MTLPPPQPLSVSDQLFYKPQLVCSKFIQICEGSSSKDTFSIIYRKQMNRIWTNAKRSCEILTVNYFCVRQKNRGKQYQHFKLLFFKEHLHFRISEQISTYGKLNLLPIKSIWLVFSSRESQGRLIQTKIYYKFFYSVWKGTSCKPLIVSAVNKTFPKCVYHW